MAAAREKLLASRRKVKEREAAKQADPVTLLASVASSSPQKEKVKTKIKVASRKSALVAAGGRSMGMDFD